MKTLIIAIVAFVLGGITMAPAQQPELPSTEKEHQWLNQFAGEWTSVSQSVAYDDQPATKCTGAMKSRMLGEFWIINEITGDMGGSSVDAIQTIGYDADKKQYIGTWVDSMMNHLWRYEGTVDANGKKFVLLADGPNFMSDGKLTKFRDSYEFKTPDTIITTSEMMGDDGKWLTFMSGEMTRKTADKPAKSTP
ncbi:MAG: DUF1579 domain-containing protein [Pirellulaceae bacterium]